MTYRFEKYAPAQLMENHLKMGASSPDGTFLYTNNKYFTCDGKPFIGVMGEFHFSRCDRALWRDELEKMKAGGITVVSTYLFMIHHVETEGEYDFSGNRDIRAFVEECKKASLNVFLRIGPWCHGECRNGGFPDWLCKKGFGLRENNDGYLAVCREWYEKIYEQIRGLLFSDGGNIIGIQLENELPRNAQHLLTLKNMAIECGFKVPYYTVTGWENDYGTEIPQDEVLPVFGGYCAAPWEDHLEQLEPCVHYFFLAERNDTSIGNDILLKSAESPKRMDYSRYPFATCELGGGIQISYHRRSIIHPMDIYAMSLTKLGCGNNLIGYYMYHGGTNPLGKYSTMQESKASGYPNDYPILNYDFQTCLSEYGQVRGQYRLLNLLHLFVQDFGDILAPMEFVSAVESPVRHDNEMLRYSMRTDGKGGFVFVNHHQRMARLKDVSDVVFEAPSVTFPAIDIAGEKSFILPFGIDLSGNRLDYATCQLVCKQGDTYFFVAPDGIAAKFSFDGNSFELASGEEIHEYKNIRIVVLPFEKALYMRRLSGKIYIGDNCDLYEKDGVIYNVTGNSYRAKLFDGEKFCNITGGTDIPDAVLTVKETTLDFVPEYSEEFVACKNPRMRQYELCVSSPYGFVTINEECDVAQIFADEKLVADLYYYGVPWEIPAKMLYGKKCVLLVADSDSVFYKEY